jgi:hypothetical protein
MSGARDNFVVVRGCCVQAARGTASAAAAAAACAAPPSCRAAAPAGRAGALTWHLSERSCRATPRLLGTGAPAAPGGLPQRQRVRHAPSPGLPLAAASLTFSGSDALRLGGRGDAGAGRTCSSSSSSSRRWWQYLAPWRRRRRNPQQDQPQQGVREPTRHQRRPQGRDGQQQDQQQQNLKHHQQEQQQQQQQQQQQRQRQQHCQHRQQQDQDRAPPAPAAATSLAAAAAAAAALPLNAVASALSPEALRGVLHECVENSKLLVAGAMSAVVSRTAVAPLERVKMDQLLRSSSHSALETALRVYHREGVLGFWKVRLALQGGARHAAAAALSHCPRRAAAGETPHTLLPGHRPRICRPSTTPWAPRPSLPQGNALNVARTAPFKALNFFSFDMYSRALAQHLGHDVGSLRFLAGAAAGGFRVCLI